LEGTVRERERLVADGGEGKEKERRREIFVQGRRRMGEEEKGVERERRDWLTADLRQAGPQLATGEER
jgi:hypothetical protein